MTSPLGSIDVGASSISEDKTLALAFQRGEPGAYEAIYSRHLPRVENVCRRLLTNSHDAQEATQEAFLRVYQGLGRFNGQYQLGAWIARIATNVCLDQLRSSSRKPATPCAFDEMEFELAEEHAVEGPENTVIRNAESLYVRKVLAQLPPLHRAAIVLRDFEGLSYTEVASALSISEVQCKALIHRARQNFKRSWIPASVAALFPFNLFGRFRKIDTSVSDHANRMARHPQMAEVASSAGHAATACNTFIQTCGAAVTDRIAGTLAAGVIALGSFAMGAQYAQQEDESSKGRVVAPALDGQELEVHPIAATSRPERNGGRKSQSSDVPPTTSEPSDPQPEPQPSEPPVDEEPSETDGGLEGDTPDPDPEPSEAPEPWGASIGFYRDAPPGSSVPSSNSVSMDCATRAFSQTMTIGVWDGATEYPGQLTLDASGTTSLALRIRADHDYHYASWGSAPSVSWSELEDGSVSFTMSGEYGPLYGSDPGSANLPTAGHFEANLTLDCSTSRVVTESVILYMQ